GATQGRPELAEEVLQHEAPDARSRVERGEDEERLEHDREVIPERERRAAERTREDARHADRQAGGTTRAREERALTDLVRERCHRRGRHRESPPRDGRRGG